MSEKPKPAFDFEGDKIADGASLIRQPEAPLKPAETAAKATAAKDRDLKAALEGLKLRKERDERKPDDFLRERKIEQQAKVVQPTPAEIAAEKAKQEAVRKAKEVEEREFKEQLEKGEVKIVEHEFKPDEI